MKPTGVPSAVHYVREMTPRQKSSAAIALRVILATALFGGATATTFDYVVCSYSQVDSTQNHVLELAKAVRNFQIRAGRLPTTEEGLESLLSMRVLDRIPLDAWGGGYRYVHPGLHSQNEFDVVSAGPDRHFGSADDITNCSRRHELHGVD